MQSPVKLWRNQKHVANLLGKVGVVIAWTVIRVPPGDFSDQAPYAVALVTLEGGKKIEAQLVDIDFDQIRMGLKVKTVIRRVTHPDPDGVIPYGIKVKAI